MTLDTTLPGSQRWPLGDADDRALMSEEVMAPLGPILVAAAGIGSGLRVLDVAAGGGNASLSVARTGATVVFTEFSYRQTNALTFRDDEFDAVISAIGVTFTPDHRTAASELVRVCRPGGTIGVISWTLEGFFGQMLAAISPYRRRGPLRVPMSALWGREPYVRALLGNRVRGVGMRRGVLEVSRFNSAEDVHGYLKTHFGPMIEVFESIGDDPLLAAELDHRLIEIAQDYMVDGAIEWEYLLVTATKR